MRPLVFFVLSPLLGVAALEAAETPVVRPNIVFILADDLGVMDVGAYNSGTFYETPNIDRLSGEGMRFANAYAACNVCSPTRYSIMTGRYPVRSGITNYIRRDGLTPNGSPNYVPRVRNEKFRSPAPAAFMPLEEKTLGEAFKEAGYRTALLGKWHLGAPEFYGPQKQGFDVVSGDIRSISPEIKNLSIPDRPQKIYRDRIPDFIETCTTWAVDDALAVMEAFQDAPFFIYLSFYQVHGPLGASEEFVAPFREKRKRMDLPEVDPFRSTFENVGPGIEERDDFTDDEEQFHVTENKRRTRIRQNHAVYAGMVAHMDACVGRVLRKLDELGLSENTIVVFMSDNGGLSTAESYATSNHPYRAGKGWNYEGGIREPLLVRWPEKIRSGTTCDVPVVSTDFYPTLLELTGLPPEPRQHLDGVSFAPLLLEQASSLDREALFWHYPHYSNQGGSPSSAVRKGDDKLILNLEDGRVQFFDLKNDPGERNDLSEAEQEKVRELKTLLLQWLEETDASFLERKDGREPWRPR